MRVFLLVLSLLLMTGPCLAGRQIPSALLPEAELMIATPSGRMHTFTVEIANTAVTRRDGLMGRTSLAPDSGMLFVFEEAAEQGFWMKNTLIPLDMVFIRADGVVANVHANAKPQDLSIISSAGPVLAVVELAGGRTKELGITPGSVVTSAALPAKSAN